MKNETDSIYNFSLFRIFHPVFISSLGQIQYIIKVYVSTAFYLEDRITNNKHINIYVPNIEKLRFEKNKRILYIFQIRFIVYFSNENNNKQQFFSTSFVSKFTTRLFLFDSNWHLFDDKVGQPYWYIGYIFVMSFKHFRNNKNIRRQI